MKRKEILVYTPIHEANLLIQEYLYENLICHCDLVDTMQKFEEKVREKLYDLIIVELFYSDNLYTADIVDPIKRTINYNTKIVFTTITDMFNTDELNIKNSMNCTVIVRGGEDFREKLIQYCKLIGIPPKMYKYISREDIVIKKIKPYILVYYGNEKKRVEIEDSQYRIIEHVNRDDLEKDLAQIYYNAPFIIIRSNNDKEIKSVAKIIRQITILPKIILIYNSKTLKTEIAKSGVEYIIDSTYSEEEIAQKLTMYMTQSFGSTFYKNEKLYVDWAQAGNSYKGENINRYFALMNFKRINRQKLDFIDQYPASNTIDEIKYNIENYLGQRVDELPKSKLLIVEDDKTTVRIITSIFEFQFEIICAETGAQTLEMLKKHAFQLILLDVKLPDVNSDDIYDDIVRYKDSAEVIVITAYAKNEAAYEFIRKGAYDYIEKPLDFYQLYKKFAYAWIRRKLGINEKSIDIHKFSLPEKQLLFNSILIGKEFKNEQLYNYDVYSVFPEMISESIK